MAESANEVSMIAITNLIRRWQDLFNLHDFDALSELYAEGASLLGTSSGRLYISRPAIRAYFKGEATVTFKDMSFLSPCPSVHLVFGFYEFEMGSKSVGETQRLQARFSFVICELEGLWHITHHHSSVVP